MNKNKNLGFTLAEVLIVIGIIGVVAALTLPNLNHATGDKETVTRVLKAYSILSEATDRAMVNYGGRIDEWDCDVSKYPIDIYWMNRIKDYLKLSKSCNEWVNSDSDDYVSCSSLAAGDFNYDNMIFQLNDGLTIGTNGYENCDDNDINWLGTEVKECSVIIIDINGPNKGKNKAGEDIFGFSLTPEGIFPGGEEDMENMEYFFSDIASDDWDRMFAASYWIVNYGNLDYLKADSNGKCNDSNIILNGTTNTSCH